jgi:hypothetical protein
MSEMAISAFVDRSRQPTDDDLASKLGDTVILWNELKRLIELRFAPIAFEWICTSKSTGWGARLKGEKRTVLYMTPCGGYFLASFALGEKAVKAAHDSDLPASVLDVIDGSKKYAEGRGLRLEVRTAGDVRNIEKLAIIKMAN